MLTTGSPSAGNRFVQRELAFEAGLQKRLESGGQFSVRQSLGTLDNNSAFLDPQDQGRARLLLDYRQPLLRGRGSQISQSQIVLAQLNADAIGFESMQRLQAYSQQVVSSYWTVYRERAVLVLRIRSTQRANEVVAELQSREDSPLVRLQLVRARAAATQRKSDLIEQQFRAITAQEQLLNLTHGPDIANPERVELIPTDIPPSLGIPQPIESVVQTAIQNRPEIKAAIADIRAASVNNQLAENELLPQLDAVLSSYVIGLRGSKDVGNAFTDQFQAGDPSYSVGMSFEVPIGRRAAKSKVHRAQLQAELLKNKLRKSLGDVALDARTMYRDSNRLSAEINNNHEGLTAAAEELNYVLSRSEMLENPTNGSLYLENLLATQARLTLAEQRFIDSRVGHSLALVSLKRATGEFMRQQISSPVAGQQVSQQAPIQQVNYEAPIQGQIQNQSGPFQPSQVPHQQSFDQFQPQGQPIGPQGIQGPSWGPAQAQPVQSNWQPPVPRGPVSMGPVSRVLSPAARPATVGLSNGPGTQNGQTTPQSGLAAPISYGTREYVPNSGPLLRQASASQFNPTSRVSNIQSDVRAAAQAVNTELMR